MAHMERADMDYREIYQAANSGVFQICALSDTEDRIVGSGTGFLTGGKLLTNFHVAKVLTGRIWVRRPGDSKPSDSGLVLASREWLARLVTSSDEMSYDYAVLDLPASTYGQSAYNFEMKNPAEIIGAEVAFLGFPFGQHHLNFHVGRISAQYKSKSTHLIQLDASVNHGNSGGPLIDPSDRSVIGLVTRKATGLSAVFDQLNAALDANIQQLSQPMGGSVRIMGIDPNQGLLMGQRHLRALTGEIARQANVGIGYAISAKHILEDGIF
jgi:S1-C subfamily serine protease